MAERNKTRIEPHYYSEKLKRKLGILHSTAGTVVEAPSGYGKTTAVRDYLESSLPQSTPVFWFTAAEEESASAAFKRLCREIERIDPQVGGHLLELGLPIDINVGEACEELRSIECGYEAFLVIDNFQFLMDLFPFSFLASLLVHGGEQLHIILITQILRRNLQAFLGSHGVGHVTEAELRFSADDIHNYYKMAGVTISPEGAARVEHNTGGWVAAVYLNLCALRERGTLSDVSGILMMMEHLVWDALEEAQQMFLLHLSPFETVTIPEACILGGYDMLPDDAQKALGSPFIRFDPSEQRYEMHSILSGLLREKRRDRGPAFDRDCLLRAGDLCRGKGESIRAMDFYTQAGDYDRMLSLDFSAFYFETVGGVPFYKLALSIAQSCPVEWIIKYPLSMLHVAYALKTACMDEEFAALLDRLNPILGVDSVPGLDPIPGEDPMPDAGTMPVIGPVPDGENDEEHTWLIADWTLLSSFLLFPDVAEMTTVLKKAAVLFRGRRSRVIFPDSPWCYGVYSPVSVFHCTPDGAEREAGELEEYYGLYAGLTGGHGSGADILFRAEYAYYACNLKDAEILAYKAAFVAQGRKQTLIRTAATFFLAWIAMGKGDLAGWRDAFDVLKECSSEVLLHSFVLPSVVDMAKAILFSEVGMGDEVTAEWLREGDFSGERRSNFTTQQMVVHLDDLLHRKQYARLVGTAEAAYPRGIRVERFGEVFPALIAAAGYLGLNNIGKATELVLQVIAFTLPGGLFCQLVYYNQILDGLVEKCIAREYPEYKERFLAAKRMTLAPFSAVYPELSPDKLSDSLTGREREIAMLAAEGLSNREIAEKLFLTSSTVRTHLRTVFKKLAVEHRTELAQRLNQKSQKKPPRTDKKKSS